MKRHAAWICFCLAAVLLCGCSMPTVDQLYSPPRRSEGYTNLQTLMQSVMSGYEYTAPQAGEYQQTVQMADLDGDGEKEYLLFARCTTGDKSLRIFIFSGNGEKYQLIDTIECAGTAFDQVAYVQINGRRGMELVVGYQVSDQILRSVAVYTMSSDKMERVLTNHYSRFLCADLDHNGLSDLFVIRPGSADSSKAAAECISIRNGVPEWSDEVSLSASVDSIQRIVQGKLNDGTGAVYIASGMENNALITDVFAFVNHRLVNVSLSSESGTSIQTIRNYHVYAADVDSDGVLELPNLVSPATVDAVDADQSQYVIRWYALNSDGTLHAKMYTYHNLTGKWYVQLDSNIAKYLVVSQKGNSFEFYVSKPEQNPEKVLTLYLLTGQKREEQAVQDNRFSVYRNESTVYAVKLEVASVSYGMTQDSLISGFHPIVQEWNTGLTQEDET